MKREETLDYHLRAAWHSISRMYNQRALKYNATMSMGFALLVIDSEGGTPATKIGPMMGLESRSLTRLLKSLEEKQLIFKESDKNDRRSVRICLTKKGKNQRDLARETVVLFNEAVRKNVGVEKLAVCLDVLQQVNKMVEQNSIYDTLDR